MPTKKMEDASAKLAKMIGWSMLLGVIIGFVLYYTGYAELSAYVKPLGTIFIRLLKMVIVPLIFSSVYMAVINLGDPKHLSSIGKKSIIYYFITTSIAVFIGLLLVNIFKPGLEADFGKATQTIEASISSSKTASVKEAQTKGLFTTIMEVGINSIPTNPIEAMATDNMLQIIVFALLLGLMGLFYQKESSAFTSFASSLEKMSHHLTHWIMKVAPYGVFGLLVDVVANAGIEALISLSKYMLVVIAGLLLHGGVLVSMASLIVKSTPFYILKNLSAALFTAFSTSSSAATLPITISCLIDNLKVKDKVASFVLPLGATINMDGTALYVSVASCFIAQVYGIDLSFNQLVIIFFTASLASVGTAAIPGASIITMGIVFGAVGIPFEGVKIVLVVDRILDMCRTTINVLGDSSGTLIIDSMINSEELRGTKRKT